MTARIRRVFPRDEVAHLWAHKVQDGARDAGGNFFFTGATLYSYGRHYVIAHILADECGPALAGRVLWNSNSYSNTTGKHKSHAWRALTCQQREQSLDLPGINEDNTREIERALITKRLPAYTEKLLAQVRENVAALDGKKHGSGPFCQALNKARTAQDVAQLFYARAGRKYPLPVLPANNEDVPADKTARAGFIMEFARAAIKKQYEENIARAERGLELARDDLENIELDYGIQRAADNARFSLRTAEAAAADYKKLYGKNGAKPGRLVTELRAIVSKLNARATEYLAGVDRRRVETTIKRFAHARGITKRSKNDRIAYKARQAASALGDAIAYGQDMADEAMRVGIPADSWFIDAANKLARTNAVYSLKKTAASVTSILNSADSYKAASIAGQRFCMGDAKREYVRAQKALAELAEAAENMPRAAAHFAGAVLARRDEIAAELATIDAAIYEENRELIRAWCSGESDKRPSYEAGTFARINGGIVETSRGASVPIEHACRLARMYAITVRRGGQSWQDGAGPMVGHYRVNNIGPDGSLIIGCHEFSPAESRRLYDVLTSCPACAEVAA